MITAAESLHNRACINRTRDHRLAKPKHSINLSKLIFAFYKQISKSLHISCICFISSIIVVSMRCTILAYQL